MADEGVFVDTNILVYAHDVDAGERHDKAADLMGELWARETPPTVSVQVLQELYVTLARKGVSRRDAAAIVHDYERWDVIANDVALLEAGIEACERFRLSLWDGMILAAALRAGALVLLSEDFQHGRDYGGVKVQNPLI